MLTVLSILHKVIDLVVISILPDQVEQKEKGLGSFCGAVSFQLSLRLSTDYPGGTRQGEEHSGWQWQPMQDLKEQKWGLYLRTAGRGRGHRNWRLGGLAETGSLKASHAQLRSSQSIL